MTASPMQIVRAYDILGNHGFDAEGKRIVPQEFADAIRSELQRVASDKGPARRAAVEDVKVWGKTGTTQQIVDGKWKDAYDATFVGGFELDSDRYTVIVVYSGAKRFSHQGGIRPATVFREICLSLK